MVDVKAFRATNNLYQKDLSQYLGVSIGFISAVERGAARLPAEQLAKLLSNPNGWDTSYLTADNDQAKIHNDYRHMSVGHNMEGCEYHGPVNNYNGVSEAEVDRIVNEKIALMQSEIDRLEGENLCLRNEVEYFKTTCDRYLKIIENNTGQAILKNQ